MTSYLVDYQNIEVSMQQISELKTILFHFLNWNKARISCLIQIVQGLFLVRTVNLTQISETFHNSAKQKSCYRRIQRFFKSFSFDMSFIVTLVSKLFMLDEKCDLIMDRTNWKWGKKNINILMISIEHFGIGIPLFWTVLNKDGTSSTKDRTRLLKKVISKLGYKKIRILLADREFIGEAWFRFLIEANIPFIIRVKKNFLADKIRNGYKVPIDTLIDSLGRKKKIKNHIIRLWGHMLFASVEYAKNAREPMIVVSNQTELDSLYLYRWRWGIETLFSCLKSRGFRMEDTHMSAPKKIEKLLFILAIAFCWAHKTGELIARKKPIKNKNHTRKEISIFRLGLNFIRITLLKIDKKFDEFLSLLDYFLPIELNKRAL